MKLDSKAPVVAMSFGTIENLLQDLQDIVSKYDISKSSIISPGLFTEKFSLLESTIQKELAPLTKFVNFMLTNAPCVSTWVQGGERRSVGSGIGKKGKVGFVNAFGDARVVR